jgi:hypothetical protein
VYVNPDGQKKTTKKRESMRKGKKYMKTDSVRNEVHSEGKEEKKRLG